MATYKGHVDFNKVKLQSGDVLVGCNPSRMGGRVIKVDRLTFDRCNMFGVAVNPTWVVKNCAHYGKTEADLSLDSTSMVDGEIENLVAELDAFTKDYPDKVKVALAPVTSKLSVDKKVVAL